MIWWFYINDGADLVFTHFSSVICLKCFFRWHVVICPFVDHLMLYLNYMLNLALRPYNTYYVLIYKIKELYKVCFTSCSSSFWFLMIFFSTDPWLRFCQCVTLHLLLYTKCFVSLLKCNKVSAWSLNLES